MQAPSAFTRFRCPPDVILRGPSSRASSTAFASVTSRVVLAQRGTEVDLFTVNRANFTNEAGRHPVLRPEKGRLVRRLRDPVQVLQKVW